MATTSWPTRRPRESPRRAGDEVGRVHAQDGEVGLRVVADELRVQFASVAQRHAQLVGAVGDVAVGQHEAVAGDDEAGARACVAGLGRLLPPGTCAPAWCPPGRPRPRRPAFGRPAADVDVHHRRADELGGPDHGARVRVERRAVSRVRQLRVPLRLGVCRGAGLPRTAAISVLHDDEAVCDESCMSCHGVRSRIARDGSAWDGGRRGASRATHLRSAPLVPGAKRAPARYHPVTVGE